MHTEQEKTGPGFEQTLPLIKSRRRSRRQRRVGEQQEKGEDRSSVLKNLCAAFLRSFRGKHSQKMVCGRGVPGITGTLGKANSHFDPTQTGLGTATTLKRLLIGADFKTSTIISASFSWQWFKTLMCPSKN